MGKTRVPQRSSTQRLVTEPQNHTRTHSATKECVVHLAQTVLPKTARFLTSMGKHMGRLAKAKADEASALN